MPNRVKGKRKAAAARKGHSQVDLAYAAGIIDGEGCIFIGDRGGNRSTNLVLKIEVASTSFALPEWLNERFGGHISRVFTQAQWRPQRRWSLSAASAAEFLELVLPYLVIKRDQAELAIEFQERKIFKGCGRLPQEEIDIRLDMAKELSEMKRAA